jgi:hypothetical protein
MAECYKQLASCNCMLVCSRLLSAGMVQEQILADYMQIPYYYLDEWVEGVT